MSPQHSNRQVLIEGTLRCVERLPPERITARAIAEESGANVASIVYHFGSKDELVTEAVISGLDRWLEEIAADLALLADQPAQNRIRASLSVVERTRSGHAGLSRTFLAAMARAEHDPRVRQLLTDGFSRTRPNLAAVLGLGDDAAAEDAAGLLHSLFVGLLFQALLDPGLAIEGQRLDEAMTRLREALP